MPPRQAVGLYELSALVPVRSRNQGLLWDVCKAVMTRMNRLFAKFPMRDSFTPPGFYSVLVRADEFSESKPRVAILSLMLSKADISAL